MKKEIVRKVTNPYSEVWEWGGMKYTVEHITQTDILENGKIVEFVNRYKVLKTEPTIKF